MAPDVKNEAERARTCPPEEIGGFLHSPSEPVLTALLQNSQLKDIHLRLLLERRDLSAVLLERIASRKEWVREPGLRRSLVAHIRTPRHVAMKLARDLEVMDLAAVSLQTSVPVEVRRLADDLLLARLAQLPLGQKLTLARRGPGRAAGMLLANGDRRIARVALDNPHLTEAQLLRALANETLSEEAVSAVAAHAKWACHSTVQAALVRHPELAMETALSLLPKLPMAELTVLSQSADLGPGLLRAVRKQIEARGNRRNDPSK